MGESINSMERSGNLDALRAIAVMLVLGNHMQPCEPSLGQFCTAASELWIRGGWIGVDIFFVLSGFLVAGLLFSEYQTIGTVSATRFLIRRGFKIYPAFWVLILVTILHAVLLNHPMSVPSLISELLFVQNYGSGLWNHTWSLAVEEHFYFGLALLLPFLARKGHQPDPFRCIPTIFLSLASICLALRIVTALIEPYSHNTHLFPTHLRIDSLFFGVCISYFYWFHKNLFFNLARHKTALTVFGIVLLLPPFILPRGDTYISTIGLTLIMAGSGCLLISAMLVPEGQTKSWRLASYVGRHSYSIYLWHMPMALWGTAIFRVVLGDKWNYVSYLGVYFVDVIAA